MKTMIQISRAYKTIFVFGIFILFLNSVNAQLQTGHHIPDISLQNNEGNSVQILSLKGKVLLVDFWASWCGPCRKANKKLVKLYKDFRDKDFEIIGISIDVDENKWKKAIISDKLEYIQLIDPKGFNARSAEIFGIEALPASFLFDKEGKLISINPSEKDIRNYLNQILKQ